MPSYLNHFIMKPLLAISISLLLTASYPAQSRHTNDTDAKLEALFRKTFPGVVDVNWIHGKTFRKAVVRQYDLITHITYSIDGDLLKTIRYYKNQYLPAYLLTKVFQRYPTADITGITEVFDADGLQYFINIKKGNRFIALKSDVLGSMTIMDQFIDASGR